MVIGIDVFKEFFKEFPDSYLIIGGTACDVIIEEAGFNPRATDDIDMILVIEALRPEFVRKFWEFIKTGNYGTKQIDQEKRDCYRFRDPEDKAYPKQIELFSRIPDAIDLDPEVHITPIPVEEGLSHLSAILLNDEYYRFTLEHSTKKDDIHLAEVEAVICMKAFAYLDNKRRKDEGQDVRHDDIIKHKYDVFRMAFMLKPDNIFELPSIIKVDLQHFADVVKDDLPSPEIFKVNRFDTKDMYAMYQQLIKSFNLKA